MLPPADDDRFAEALVGHFDVVMPLAPGYTGLAEIDDIDDVHDLALYDDDVLRALDLGPIDVVGHSSGGMMAAELSQALTAALKFLWPFRDQGLNKRIHRVSCPSLVVWGRDDINPPAQADQFVAALPGSRVELLDGAHLLPYEQPDQVSKLVHEFALSR